jgi:hypothetical protein
MINMVVDGKLVDLETPSVENKQEKKGLYRGFETSIKLEGESSPVNVSRSESRFVFRPINKDVHPSQQIKLYPFLIEKGDRTLDTGGMNMFGGSKDKKNDDTSVSIQFEKIETGCYTVTFSGNLTPGEYAFCLGEAGSVDVQGQGTFGSKGQLNWYAFTVK